MDADRLLKSAFVIGAAGALVTAVGFMPGATPIARFVNFVCGCLIAAFMGPATASHFHLEQPNLVAASIFLWGMLGVSVMQGVRDWLTTSRIGQWLNRAAHKPGDQP